MDRTVAWNMLVDPLQKAGVRELLQRAGLPPLLASTFESPAGRRALAAYLWRPAARWQEADAQVPHVFASWLDVPPAVLARRLPVLGAYVHAASIRRLVRSQEQRAVREALGLEAYNEILSASAASIALFDGLHGNRSLSLNPINGSTREGLEREGIVTLASMALTFGLAWLEVLRLQVPQRLLPWIESASPWQQHTARAYADSILSRVAAIVPAES
jgi:hypothetical protein